MKKQQQHINEYMFKLL